ncbi:MAG: type IV secretion system DNA-binding domain-containing protein [Armatimonadetes bacterium]|nr:type IV secretion system DNA-binding domain-containing protein [Armatimonadota bacterium]
MRGIAGLIESLAVKGVLAASGRRPTAQERSAPGFLLGHELGADPTSPGRPIGVLSEERRKHLYAIGATGCGKTSLLLRLIEDEVSQGRTCVVLDLRGDLVDRILTRLAGQNAGLKGVSLLDLREDAYFMPFNPLACPGDLYSRSLHLLEVVKRGSESWGIQLEETLRNSLFALASAGKSLVDIERLLGDPIFREQVVAVCPDEHVQGFFGRYGTLSAERQQSWSLPVLNKITPLLSIPQMRRMLSGATGFDWQAVLDRRGQLLLVALAAHRFHGASHLLGGLLVSSLQSAVMARAEIREGE